MGDFEEFAMRLNISRIKPNGKVHWTRWDGAPVCGADAPLRPLVTAYMEKVTPAEMLSNVTCQRCRKNVGFELWEKIVARRKKEVK